MELVIFSAGMLPGLVVGRWMIRRWVSPDALILPMVGPPCLGTLTGVGIFLMVMGAR